MIRCPACGQSFDPEAHPALDTLPEGASTAEAYAAVQAKCPNCGHELAPEE